METIKEAAVDYAEEVKDTTNGMFYADCQDAFKAGAIFAQEWIGFEKELPKVLMEIIVKDFRERKHKRVVIPQDNTDIKYLAETFTHWRPVERL